MTGRFTSGMCAAVQSMSLSSMTKLLSVQADLLTGW